MTYLAGTTLDEPNADPDEKKDCAAGINLATLDWCLREWKDGYRIMLCEFKRRDLACVPIGSDGKFRVRRCKVLREIDLSKIPWPPPAPEPEPGKMAEQP